MAEEWTELIWVFISIIAFSVVIAVAFNFMQLGKGIENQMYQDQANAAHIEEIRKFLPYDGTELSGSEAFSAALSLPNAGYPTILVYESRRAFLLFPSESSVSSMEKDLKNVANASTIGNDTSNYLKVNTNGSYYTLRYSSSTCTSTALLEYFDKYAQMYGGVGSDGTFSEFTFESHILEDSTGDPLGVIMFRKKPSGSGVYY